MNLGTRWIGRVALAAVMAMAAAGAAAAGEANGIRGYEQGRWVVSGSLGVGLASTYGGDGSPLLAVTAETGVTPNVSVGGSAGMASSKYSAYGYSAKYTYSVVAARASYHFVQVMPEKPLDLYAGVSLGYNHVGVSESGALYGYDVGASYVLYGIHGGARWYLNPRTAVFGELGYGLGALAVGASIRL